MQHAADTAAVCAPVGVADVVRAHADTDTTAEKAKAASNERASYAVAAANDLDLIATIPRRLALLIEPITLMHTSGYSFQLKNLFMQLHKVGR